MTLSDIWIDKLAIRELLERYMRLNDDSAADAIAEFFDEDAVFQVTGTVRVGREAIRDMFRGSSEVDPSPWTDPGQLFIQPRSTHISSNPIIDVSGDTATAETDFQVVRRDETGRAKVALIGRYRDRLRRAEDGRWLITHRTGVSLARPGDEGTDTEWRRAIERMPEAMRQLLHE